MVKDRASQTASLGTGSQKINLRHVFRQRQRLVLGLYVGLCLICASLFIFIGDLAVKAFALGLFAPGAGFLFWESDANVLQLTAVLAACVTFAAFFDTFVIWFVTGNILLPPFI